MITINNTKTIYDLIKNAGREYENRVFFRFERDNEVFEKGYGTFSRDTLAVASYISDQGEKAGHPIHAAILGKCSYEYLTVLMGAPCAGGVSIPLDVQLSIEKMAENINKADTDILFYDKDFASEADELQALCPSIRRFVCLQSRKNTRCVTMIHRVYRNENFAPKIKPDRCAMIIFTSGTTGHGKGVMLSHSNIIDNMFCTDDDTEICLNVLPIHHVFCISGDIMLVLRYGSTLCLCDDLTKMLYYIQLFQPTQIRMVPMMAKMLVNRVSILKSKYPEKSVSELKEQVLGRRMSKVTSGGGYLSEALSTALLDLGITTGQGYGMSECSPKISVPDYTRKDKVASVGHLVTGCKVRIVDGEIQVSSPSVMMGYYNDPELTAEAITEDGWLCTGDLGYLDDEDFLYLSGRKKNLIILSNGENVSPEMIEKLFDGDRLVGDIVAYGKGEIIAAEVYPNFEYAQEHGITDIQAELDALVAKHNEELPTYAHIAECTVRTIPFKKTSSKKIMRDAFFKEKSEKESRKQTVRKPETELQQRIFDLVAREIGHTEFSIDENLYKIGLDSMGSTILISDFVEELGQDMTLAELMDNPSIIELEAHMLQKAAAEKPDLSAREVYPLTSIQKYFAYIIPGNTTGNLPFAFRMGKDVDLDRLKAAIYTALDAHPALKAIVKPTEQKYYAIFRDDSRVIDIPIENIDDAAAEEMMQKLVIPFRYRADDDLVHIRLFEGQNYKYMFIDVAHFMGDGMSMNIIMEDIRKAYDGEEIESESGKYSMYEYILEESLRDKNGIRENNIAYVDDLMKGIKMSRSILNKAHSDNLQEGVYGTIRKRFEKVARKNVLYYGRKNGVSENAMFLAAFNYTISLFSGQDEVFCSSIHSGRTDSRWNRIAGSLFQNYYCKYNRIPHEKVDDFIRRTGNQIMNTMKCLVSTPKESEMFFQFQGDILDVQKIGDSTEKIQVSLDALPFHLQVMFDDKGYRILLRYWENRFDRDMLELFLNCFEEILGAMLEETSVRCLKNHLSQEAYPKQLYIESGKLDAAAGRKVLKYAEADEKVRVYILDESNNKKPYGAWGPVYIMNYEPVNYTDVMQYPYGTGSLFNTGLIGRINLDGTIDFLHEAGRKVLIDGLRGRNYIDLKKAEEVLLTMPEITSAECYMAFDREINEFSLFADIKAVAGAEGKLADEAGALTPEFETALKAYMKEQAGDLLVPKYVKLV